MGTLQEFPTVPPKAFKCGAQVCLRTGGPGMTVRSVTKQPKGLWIVTCDWFNDSEHAQADFLSAQLIPWEGEDEEEEQEQEKSS